MKKLIITIFATLFCLNAMALEKINVIKHSRPGGLIDRLNVILAESLGERFGVFIEVANYKHVLACLSFACFGLYVVHKVVFFESLIIRFDISPQIYAYFCLIINTSF